MLETMNMGLETIKKEYNTRTSLILTQLFLLGINMRYTFPNGRNPASTFFI